MAEIYFHPDAENEYKNAYQWYRSRSKRASDRFEAEVERLVELIVTKPEFFPKFDDKHHFAVLKRFPFSLIYQVQTETIHILAVAHSRRSTAYWKNRKTQ